MDKNRPWYEALVFIDREDISRKDIARRAGISAQYLSDCLTGRRRPNAKVVNGVATALNVPRVMLLPVRAFEFDKDYVEEVLAGGVA